MYNKFMPSILQIFTFSVNIFTKFTECIHPLPSERHLTPVLLHEYVMHQKVKQFEEVHKKIDTMRFTYMNGST